MSAGIMTDACPITDRAPRAAWREAGRTAASLLVIAGILTLLFAAALDLRMTALPRAFVVMLAYTTGIGVPVSALYSWVWPAIAPRARGVLAQAAVHVGFVGGGTLAGTELAIRAAHLVGGSAPDAVRPHVLVVGLVVSTVATAINLRADRLRRQAREAELRAQLAALQARTNPHFLFNSLNTVAGLIPQDPARAERVVERLSDLYRHALQRSRVERLRLEEEVAAVRDYLDIEGIRLGDRLGCSVSCDADAMAALVPPMILQPLVENAVLHGIAPRREGGRVDVSARRRGDELLLEVVDDGPGPGGSGHLGTGTALDDLRERLALACGDTARVEVARATPDGGCRVTVTLPFAGGGP